MNMRRFMMIVETALAEAPLADFGTFGDMDNAGSMRADDLRAIRSEKWLTKVRTQFDNFPLPLNVYVYNGEGGMVKVAGKVVRADDLTQILPLTGRQTRDTVKDLTGKVPENFHAAITVILVENEGDERMPLTPWILGHRICHAILESAGDRSDRDPAREDRDIKGNVQALNRVFNDGLANAAGFLRRSQKYQGQIADASDPKYISDLALVIGTMRSARTGNLPRPGEFMVELMTQYLIKGRVIFNRPILDDKGRNEPYAGPNADLLAKAREKYDRSGEHFADRVLKPMNRPAQKPWYSVVDAKGKDIGSTTSEAGAQAMAAKEPGAKVVTHQPNKGALTRYKNYLAKREALVAMWNEWEEHSMLIVENTVTEAFDQKMDKLEKDFDEHIKAVFDACIGKALLL